MRHLQRELLTTISVHQYQLIQSLVQGVALLWFQSTLSFICSYTIWLRITYSMNKQCQPRYFKVKDDSLDIGLIPTTQTDNTGISLDISKSYILFRIFHDLLLFHLSDKDQYMPANNLMTIKFHFVSFELFMINQYHQL